MKSTDFPQNQDVRKRSELLILILTPGIQYVSFEYLTDSQVNKKIGNEITILGKTLHNPMVFLYI